MDVDLQESNDFEGVPFDVVDVMQKEMQEVADLREQKHNVFTSSMGKLILRDLLKSKLQLFAASKLQSRLLIFLL